MGKAKEKKRSTVSQLLDHAGSYKSLTIAGCILSAVAMFVGMLVLMFAFDWRMGAACLISAGISIVAMFSIMGGEKAKVFADYQMALDKLSKAGTEYVRGIPVVKVFQQTVYAFRSFKEAIDEYSDKAEYYQGDMCRMPQTVNLTFTEGAFVFLVPLKFSHMRELQNTGAGWRID